ncbi:MAG TPA: Cro/CI family transcriptional regulator [Steroidobacteraceae bacterium]|nr:Cro/CI family transcriptional regulator [Steroidobacteraceae bacterium]
MRTSKAIDYFKTKSAIAKALGISGAAVSKWGDVIPVESAKALEIRTNGALRVDWALYGATRRALLERQDIVPQAPAA